MAWSQSDIDKLKAALASGHRRVRYTSGEVEYQSVDDMLKVLAEMQREVAPDAAPRRTVASYTSGF